MDTNEYGLNCLEVMNLSIIARISALLNKSDLGQASS